MAMEDYHSVLAVPGGRQGRPRSVEAEQPLRVAVFTTSYPRDAEDFTGRFVADLVERMREQGLEVEVVSPGVYRDYGLSLSHSGIVRHMKHRPWLAPLLLLSMVRTLRRAAQQADLVHANWLAGAAVARFCGRPFVVTLHGSGSAGRFSDLALARHMPWLVRFLLRRAGAVICVSNVLADSMRSIGVKHVHFVPNGVAIPSVRLDEADEPFVLFAGRLSEEKGIRDLVEATRGLQLVVAGDGPLRWLVPDALGFVPHQELERLYDRAAIVVLPSYREGLPVCVIEAMAHGRPVVATAVGGIPELVEDGRTGLLVAPGDAAGLRVALERLLSDAELRDRMGLAGRNRVSRLCGWNGVIEETLASYREALAPHRSRLVR